MQALKIVLALVQIKLLSVTLSQFYDTAKPAKKAFTQADRALGIK